MPSEAERHENCNVASHEHCARSYKAPVHTLCTPLPHIFAKISYNHQNLYGNNLQQFTSRKKVLTAKVHTFKFNRCHRFMHHLLLPIPVTQYNKHGSCSSPSHRHKLCVCRQKLYIYRTICFKPNQRSRLVHV